MGPREPGSLSATSDQLSNEPRKDSLEDKTVTLNKPDSTLFLFFIVFFSLSFYSCFWLVARARDINKLQKSKLTPWLWFFVPLIALAQLFAWPGLIKKLQSTQQDRGVKRWNAWNGGWVALVFITALVISSSERVFGNMNITFLALLLWSGFIAILHHQFSLLKLQGHHIDLRKQHIAIRIGKWLSFVLFAIISTFTIYELSLKPLFQESLQKFQSGDEYKSKEIGLRFPFTQDGWSQVPIGSYSDGSAASEFSGPLAGSYILVFNHDSKSSFDSIANFRLDQFSESYGPNKCTQQRQLLEAELKVLLVANCETIDFGEPTGEFFSVIRNGTGYVEVISEVSASKIPFKRHKAEIQNMLSQVRAYE
ncbi:hypothetical protein [uncultured Pseudoteredinibacter sp.]|uniref:hypothetical protein n=1 Tax=uncultured Pseudoteredinibacter sp. TaxID=1641701 RepID=UPI00260591E2|nr:hypothetical protein [uncultured Pseudoteredinibacter sp.]